MATNNYQFLDAFSSVQTAASSVVGVAHQPLVQIASVLTSIPVTGTVTASIGGAININSVIGAVTLYSQPGSYVSGVSSIIQNSNPASILGAPGSNLRNYITAIKVTNGGASETIVDIKDSGANVLDTGYAAATGGGWSSTFPTPIRQPTTNASIDAQSRSNSSILVQITGFIAP